MTADLAAELALVLGSFFTSQGLIVENRNRAFTQGNRSSCTVITDRCPGSGATRRRKKAELTRPAFFASGS
jgi:hypothetical protein